MREKKYHRGSVIQFCTVKGGRGAGFEVSTWPVRPGGAVQQATIQSFYFPRPELRECQSCVRGPLAPPPRGCIGVEAERTLPPPAFTRPQTKQQSGPNYQAVHLGSALFFKKNHGFL